MFAGGLFIKGSYSNFIHLAYTSEGGQYIPEQYQTEEIIPGIGHLYDNGNGYNFCLVYLFNNINESNVHFLLNLDYERHSINSKEKGVELVFGNTLNISAISLSVGLGLNAGNFAMPIHLYFNCGPLFNFSEGKTAQDNMNIVFDYPQSVFFRLMAGADFPIINANQGLTISASYDLGSIERGKVNYYNNSNWIARANPVGDSRINDDRISLSIGIFYKIL
jgi:hypothetical protein